MERKECLVQFKEISLRLYNQILFSGTSWTIQTGEHWAVLGANGSGKTTLVKAVAGRIPVIKGNVYRHNPRALKENIGYVSFETHREYLDQERLRDEERHFSGQISQGETVKSFICKETPAVSERELARIISLFQLGSLLKRAIPALSTGEMRKAVIARALMKKPSLLILDEPFDGLDKKGSKTLSRHLRVLSRFHVQIILVTHRYEEIVREITHILVVDECRVVKQGKRRALLNSIKGEKHLPGEIHRSRTGRRILPSFYSRKIEYDKQELVRMNTISVAYGDVSVFRSFSWTMIRGENWLITGPNGSGKSTLLSLITGDNPQAYKNEIYLFSRRRGSGESIWDIKKKMGCVSSRFHLDYLTTTSVLHVIISGFFDSRGLYKKPSEEQTAIARGWLDMIGLSHRAGSMFRHLSFGEQRMVLIARSMVKSPILLILDEPCQGLDRKNRQLVLELVDEIGFYTDTDLIFVTHYSREAPGCITHKLVLPA